MNRKIAMNSNYLINCILMLRLVFEKSRIITVHNAPIDVMFIDK